MGVSEADLLQNKSFGSSFFDKRIKVVADWLISLFGNLILVPPASADVVSGMERAQRHLGPHEDLLRQVCLKAFQCDLSPPTASLTVLISAREV